MVKFLSDIQMAAQDAAALAASIATGNVPGAIVSGINLIGNLGGLLGGGPSEHERIVEDNLRQIAANTAEREGRFAGIGGAENRRASLGLLDAFKNGQLDASRLGKLSREDILRILGDAAGLIESLGESALDAANERSIIPKGFRSAALAFEAQIPGLTAAIPARRIDQPLVNVKDLLPDGLEIGDADTLLNRLIPQPIQITGAELLDRLIAVGALPGTMGLPTSLPGDGAALPQIAATLSSSNAVLAQIVASLSTLRPDPAETQAGQRETNAVLSRLAELLAKAKVGTTINSGDIILQIENDGKDAPQLALDIRRALEDLSMADFGRTDRWGQT